MFIVFDIRCRTDTINSLLTFITISYSSENHFMNYYTYVLFFVYFFCSMLNNKNTGIPSKYNVTNRSKKIISPPTSCIELFILKVTLSALEVVKDCSATAVAQSVERQSHNLKVVSSILTRGIYFSKN